MAELDEVLLAYEAKAWRCMFRHTYGCECSLRSPERVALRKRTVRAWLALPPFRPRLP